MFSAGGHLYAIDELLIYATSESLVTHGTFSLLGEEPLFRLLNEPFYGYSKFGLLQPLLASPLIVFAKLVGIGGWVLVDLIFNPAVTALAAVLVMRLSKDLGYPLKTSVLASLLFGVGTIAWPYAKTFNELPLGALFLLFSIIYLHKSASSGKNKTTLIAALSFGLAVIARFSLLMFLPIVIMYLGLGIRKMTRRAVVVHLISFITVVLLFLVLYLGYDYLRFGSLLETGYGTFQDVSGPEYSGSILVGLYGLLFSSGAGLLIYCPIAVLFPSSIVKFSKQHRPEALLFTALFLESLLFYARLSNGLWAGWNYWGPRYLLPVLPYIVLPISSMIDTSNKKNFVKWTIAYLFACSVLVNLLAVLVDFNKGFELLWAVWRVTMVDSLWNPSYSPIATHWNIIFTPNALSALYPTGPPSIEARGIPSIIDSYLYYKFGLPAVIALLVLMVLEISILVRLLKVKKRT
jgi:hypothetical protein